MLRLETLATFALVAGTFLGCGPTEKTQRRTLATGSQDERGGEATATTAAGTTAPRSFLVTAEMVRSVQPLVLPLQVSDGGGTLVMQSADLAPLAAELSAILAEAMRVKGLAPGRAFEVVIVEDGDVNASAVDERITINAGLLRSVSPESALAVLCHEMVHSFRNHSRTAEADLAGYNARHADAAVALDASLRAFIEKHYDAAAGAYRHDAAAFAGLAKQWRTFWRDYETARKLEESYADTLGLRVCRILGMETRRTMRGLDEALRAEGGAGALDGPPATDVQVTRAELPALLRRLLGRETHPTVAERQKQLGAVEGAVADAVAGDFAERILAVLGRAGAGDPGLALAPVSSHSCQGGADPMTAFLEEALR